MKYRKLIITSIYSITIIVFSIYWMYNFGKHVHYKGDEFFVFAEIILLFSYIFYISLHFLVKRLNYFFIALTPIVTGIVAFIVGASLLLLIRVSAVPWKYILTYGAIYGLLNVIAAYIFSGNSLADDQSKSEILDPVNKVS